VEEKIIAQCSNCKTRFRLSSEKVGKKIKCSKCANIFVAEELKEETKARIVARCSNCQAEFRLGREKIGKKVRCSKCKGVFVVEELVKKPSSPEAPPAPQPPQPKTPPAPSVGEAPPAPPAEEQQQPTPAVQEIVPLKQRPRPLKVKDFLETQHMRFLPAMAEGVNAHVSYTFTEKGKEPEFWTLKIQNGACEIKEGEDPSAKSQVKMSTKTYLKIATGQSDARVAYALGRFKIKGDKTSLIAVRECFEKPGLKDWK